MLTEQQIRDAWMSLPRGPVLTEEGAVRVAAFAKILDNSERDMLLIGGSFACFEEEV
jgi:hypothetical protein